MLQPEKKKKIPARRYRRVLFAIVAFALLMTVGMNLMMRRVTRPAQILYFDRPSTPGTREVQVMNADGNTAPVLVSGSISIDGDAEWVGDGSLISFSMTSGRSDRQRRIYQLNPDGSQRHLVITVVSNYDSHYSSDGRYLLFTGNPDGNFQKTDIMKVDMQGNLTNLTADEDDNEYQSDWSSNGQSIVFVCALKKLCTMNADGTERHVFTETHDVFNPQWSPDGSQIAFQCNVRGLCVIRTDSSQPVLISDRYYSAYQNFAWSPDSAYLAFVYQEDNEKTEIYRVNRDGTNLIRLTHNEARVQYPAWSPDGSQIAFVTNRDSADNDRSEIYIMNLDGTNQRRLTNRASIKEYPQWRPNPCGQWDIVCYLTRP